MSAKSISKQLKSKGLQRLRWYCQLCEKQCRDENGFKCHCASAAHKRQLAVFAQNQKSAVSGYSEQFKREFLSILETNHRNSRVSANKVYNELIAHRSHIHMNATRWTSLTEFVHHLASESVLELEDTDKGIFIAYAPSENNVKESKSLKRRAVDEIAERNQLKVLRGQVKRVTTEAQKQEQIPTTLHSFPSDFSMDISHTRKQGLQATKSHLIGTIVSLGRGQARQKYLVTGVVQGVASLRSLKTSEKLQIPVGDLCTAIGARVKVVDGLRAGFNGEVVTIDASKSTVEVRFNRESEQVETFPFGCVSKLAC